MAKKLEVVPIKRIGFPMRKAHKPMWQSADKSLRVSMSLPALERAVMDYEVKKPAGYTGI